ncbi:hypothetical protein GCM10007881_63970 [Mesorhizobium huakuii]|uniref:hypothetical protein n=1 Tax=Mesorhizobium huakuii TaxID=28104 RepID=UPI00235D080E|nr:hypothetical protein [Mesorhizobium huakuii]GLQ82874.1 hypothetical protein GCM10007881_63970 [Mesorhizobium huakuii]
MSDGRRGPITSEDSFHFGSGYYLGYLQDTISDSYTYVHKLDRKCDVFGDRPVPGEQWGRINLNSCGRYGKTWFDASDTMGIGVSDICTLPGNVARALVGTNIRSINLDHFGTSDLIITLIEWVDPPAPPAPPDPLHTIGTAGASTAIRIEIGAPINPVLTVGVTLTEDYSPIGGAFPRPVATPAHGTIPSGTTVQFFGPEAAALVAASAATLA